MGNTATVIDFDDISLSEIITLDDFLEKYPNWPRSRIERAIYLRRTNGAQAAGAFKKIFGRWHIVEPALKAWLLASEE